MNVGEKLRRARKHRQLTQKELSTLSGVAEITIRKYEAGSRQPQSEQLQKLSAALDIPIGYLFDEGIFAREDWIVDNSDIIDKCLEDMGILSSTQIYAHKEDPSKQVMTLSEMYHKSSDLDKIIALSKILSDIKIDEDKSEIAFYYFC